MRTRQRWASAAVVTALVVATVGCSDRQDRPDYVNRVGGTLATPDGEHVATLIDAGVWNGVQMSRPTITTASGEVVFQDDRMHSHRHGVGLVWESSETLWVLSSDLGNQRVDLIEGRWVNSSGVPPEPIMPSSG